MAYSLLTDKIFGIFIFINWRFSLVQVSEKKRKKNITSVTLLEIVMKP